MNPCPHCGGSGVTIRLEPTCCLNNLTKGGECRGYCAAPEEVEVPCSYCGGSGYEPEELNQ